MNKPMQTVNFINMADGTKEEYAFLAKQEEEFVKTLPDRLLESLQQLDSSFGGYKVSRMEHSLQSATRAFEAGEDEEYVVAALLHDIGDNLAPLSHSEMIAAVLRPFVSERVYWIVKQHGLFQSYYYAHHHGQDRNQRDIHKDHPWYQDCVDFCAKYDQNCFDPDFQSKPIAFFRPMVERVFSEPKHFGF